MQPHLENHFNKGILNQAHAEERRADLLIERGKPLLAISSLQTSAVLLCNVLSGLCTENQPGSSSQTAVLMSLTSQLAATLRRQRELFAAHRHSLQGEATPLANITLRDVSRVPTSEMGARCRQELEDQREMLHRILQSHRHRDNSKGPEDGGRSTAQGDSPAHRSTGQTETGHPLQTTVTSDPQMAQSANVTNKAETFVIEELAYNKKILQEIVDRLTDENAKLREAQKDLEERLHQVSRVSSPEVEGVDQDELPPLEPVSFEFPV